MSSLTISPTTKTNTKLPTIRLLKGQQCVVGSSTRADYVYDLPNVPAELFRLICHRSGGFLECISADNHITLNGTEIGRCKVSNGDKIGMGGMEFLVQFFDGKIKPQKPAGEWRDSDEISIGQNVDKILGFDSSHFNGIPSTQADDTLFVDEPYEEMDAFENPNMDDSIEVDSLGLDELLAGDFEEDDIPTQDDSNSAEETTRQPDVEQPEDEAANVESTRPDTVTQVDTVDLDVVLPDSTSEPEFAQFRDDFSEVGNRTISVDFVSMKPKKEDIFFEDFVITSEEEFQSFWASRKDQNVFLVGAGRLLEQPSKSYHDLMQQEDDGAVLFVSTLPGDQLESLFMGKKILNRLRYPGAVAQMVSLFPKDVLKFVFSNLSAMILVSGEGEMDVLASTITGEQE